MNVISELPGLGTKVTASDIEAALSLNGREDFFAKNRGMDRTLASAMYQRLMILQVRLNSGAEVEGLEWGQVLVDRHWNILEN